MSCFLFRFLQPGERKQKPQGTCLSMDYPSADARILPILTRLLYDKTPCLLAIPYRFGEIRWLAAHALVAERAAQAIMKPVRLPNVVPPLDTADVVSHEDKAGINGNGCQ